MPSLDFVPPVHDDRDGILIFAMGSCGATVDRETVRSWPVHLKYQALSFAWHAANTNDDAMTVIDNAPEFLKPFLPE